MNRSYSELDSLKTVEERFAYLKCPGDPGKETLGSLRYLCQEFYRSDAWKEARDKAILRDDGRELGIGDEIMGRIYVHHINPLTAEDFMDKTPALTDPENLICMSFKMHQAIHYEDAIPVGFSFTERKKYDTTPWKKAS